MIPCDRINGRSRLFRKALLEFRILSNMPRRWGRKFEYQDTGASLHSKLTQTYLDKCVFE